jgi:trimeric autotransporter adhesin
MKKIYALFFCSLLFNFAKAQTCTPTITATSNTICAGGTATLTATGATTYTWSANAGAAVSATVVVIPTSTDTYTVTAATGTCVATETITVYVNPNPTVSGSSCNMCAGSSCTLTCAGAVTYTWMPGGFTGTPYPVTPSSSTIFTVAGTDANGCVGTATVPVTVNPNPTVTASATSSVCSGTSTTLTANGATTYAWAGPNLNSATGSTVTANPTAAAVYTVTGGVGTCSAITTVSVGVNTSPSVTFTMQANATPHIWDAYPTYTGTGLTASWSWGDGSTSSGLYPSHTYTLAGTYNICVTVSDANACVDSSCQNDYVYRTTNSNTNTSTIVQVDVINGSMGIKNQGEAISPMKIYPNPAKNIISVSSNQFASNSQIKIIDLLGNEVLNQKPETKNQSTQIDISKLQDGIYFVQFQSNGKICTAKFVKE